MMISRISASLSICPYFEQVRLQSFKLTTQRFNVVLNLFFGGIPILQQVGQTPSPVKRNQRLDNMVTADDGFVIGSGKLKDGLRPQVRWKIERADFKRCDSLQFGKRCSR